MRERELTLESLRLSVDHKPNLPGETERVISGGGQVRNVNSCWRVTGPPGTATMLAVSRALGNRDLKDAAKTTPLISCEPQMATRLLTPRDRLLILASDGLWDVVNDGQAVKLACDAAKRARATAPMRPPEPPDPEQADGDDGGEGGGSSQGSQSGGSQPSRSRQPPRSIEEQLARSAASADPAHTAWAVEWQRHLAEAAAKALVKRALE